MGGSNETENRTKNMLSSVLLAFPVTMYTHFVFLQERFDSGIARTVLSRE